MFKNEYQSPDLHANVAKRGLCGFKQEGEGYEVLLLQYGPGTSAFLSGGPYFEVFSPQGRELISHWKIGSGVKKIFEKDVKGFVYVLEGTPSATKMHIPKDSKQSVLLVQRYLVFQVYLVKGQDFSLEIGVCDMANNKRRIQLSTAQKEIHVTPLHARIPLTIVHRAVWLNLCVDMVSVVGEIWNGQTFRAIDHIAVSANCKLRRIFTMKTQPPDTTNDDEIYGIECSNIGEVELIPKQVQIAPDVPQFTQVLTVSKVRWADRQKDGKVQDFGEQLHPGSMLDLDLNSSGNKGSFHIAFGSKINAPPPESSRRSARTGSNTSRSFRSTLTHADGSLGSGHVQESVSNQGGLLTVRGGVPKVPVCNNSSGDQGSELSLQEEHHGCFVTSGSEQPNPEAGISQSHMVTPHPPREPSSDRVRRYHRVKSVPTGIVGNSNIHVNMSGRADKDSSQSLLAEATRDSGIGSKDAISVHYLSNIAVNAQAQGGSNATDISSNQTSYHHRQHLLNASQFHRLKAALSPSNSEVGAEWEDKPQPDVGDSVSDVIELLKDGRSVLDANPRGSSESSSEESSAGEYEESDDECSSDTNRLHIFVSRPMRAPHKNVSSSTSDQEQAQISKNHMKSLRSSIQRAASEILSSRGARPEDDFHSGETSSDEYDAVLKVRSQASGLHSGILPSNTTNPRTADMQADKGSMSWGRTTGLPKASGSPDFKRALFNPRLHAGQSTQPKKTEGVEATQTVRRSRKSLREITPQVDENSHSVSEQKTYDFTKYQMAEVTESFEAQMFASMRQHEEDEMEDVSQPSAQLLFGIRPNPSRLHIHGPVTHCSLHVYSESPATTSDEDTSFSTWKAPAPYQMVHNYQEEMKSRLSSDTLTSSNPRDWSSVFSPPIVLPSDRDPDSTLQGPLQDLSQILPESHSETTAAGGDEDELDLMFDPNLNCYYDPKTLKYYELVT